MKLKSTLLSGGDNAHRIEYTGFGFRMSKNCRAAAHLAKVFNGMPLLACYVLCGESLSLPTNTIYEINNEKSSEGFNKLYLIFILTRRQEACQTLR